MTERLEEGFDVPVIITIHPLIIISYHYSQWWMPMDKVKCKALAHPIMVVMVSVYWALAIYLYFTCIILWIPLNSTCTLIILLCPFDKQGPWNAGNPMSQPVHLLFNRYGERPEVREWKGKYNVGEEGEGRRRWFSHILMGLLHDSRTLSSKFPYFLRHSESFCLELGQFISIT